jgi:hypothetical protein
VISLLSLLFFGVALAADHRKRTSINPDLYQWIQVSIDVGCWDQLAVFFRENPEILDEFIRDYIGRGAVVWLQRTPLLAMKAWHFLDQHYSCCCGDIEIVCDRFDGFSFHTESFDSGYYPYPDEKDIGVDVEAGVLLLENEARTYWIFDSDSTGNSFTMKYGEPIPYPANPSSLKGWNRWLRQVEKQLELASKDAFDHDVRSCSKCGDHFNTPSCPCKDDEE